jgi:hypothetical protein
MNRKSKKRILYGNASYKEIIHKNGYFVALALRCSCNCRNHSFFL